MKFEKSPAWLVETFDGLLAQAGAEADRRQMFGCPCAFTRGQMYAGLFGREVFVRLPEDERAALLAQGATPFDPMKGRPMREYVVLPEAMLDDEEALGTWLSRARRYAESLPPKAAAKKKRAGTKERGTPAKTAKRRPSGR